MARSRFLIAAACLALAGVTASLAQIVDGLDVEALRSRTADQAADAHALADQVKRRGDAFRDDAEALSAVARTRMTGLARGKLPADAAGPVNLDALVRSAAHNADAPRGDAPQLIVFASLSIPAASLKPLIADTARAGGVVVFRGFPGNSAKSFVGAFAKSVDGDSGLANIGIDPRLFRAFAIDAVPTIVAVSSDFDLCAGFACRTAVPPHDRLSGNVTLDYALTTFVDGRGPGAGVAAVARARLREPRS